MQNITIYRYTRPDGGTSISPQIPEGEYTTLSRLVADEGMVLVNGEKKAYCVDTETTDAWVEIVDTEEPDAETEEKAVAYDIITGVIE